MNATSLFFQQFINGFSLGSIYALIALGYTMVYGIVTLINFAHGDIMMIGAYAGYFVLCAFGASVPSFALAFFAAMLFADFWEYLSSAWRIVRFGMRRVLIR